MTPQKDDPLSWHVTWAAFLVIVILVLLAGCQPLPKHCKCCRHHDPIHRMPASTPLAVVLLPLFLPPKQGPTELEVPWWNRAGVQAGKPNTPKGLLGR